MFSFAKTFFDKLASKIKMIWSFFLLKTKSKDKFIFIIKKILFFFGVVTVLTMFSDYCRLFTFGGKVFVLPFYLSFISFPLFLFYFIFLERPRNIEKIFICGAIVIMFSSLLYLSLALIQQPFFVGYKNSSPLKVYLLSLLKYIYDFVAILFLVFFTSLLSQKEISRAIYSLIIIWFLLTIFQFIIFKTKNINISYAYDTLDFLRIIPDSKLFLNQNSFRAYGFSREPASSWIFFSVFSIPFLTTKLFIKSSRWNKLFNTALLILVMLSVFLTKSPTSFLGVFLSFFVSLYCLVSDHIITKRVFLIFIMAFISFAILCFAIPFTRKVLLEQIIFRFIDASDNSSLDRYSSLYNNILIFAKSPIFGCGDGLQAFYYFKNIINSVFAQNYGVYTQYYRNSELLTGSSALPSLIGGFGLYGIVGFFLLCKMNLKLCSNNKKNLISIFYRGGFISIVVCMLTALHFHHNYELLFVLFMPLCLSKNEASVMPIMDSGSYYYIEI